MVKVWFPNMSLTLVRRSTAKLPKNMYMFRCDPKYTKLEIKEYLTKVYGVSVASVNTVNMLGECAPWGWGPLATPSPVRVAVVVAVRVRPWARGAAPGAGAR